MPAFTRLFLLPRIGGLPFVQSLFPSGKRRTENATKRRAARLATPESLHEDLGLGDGLRRPRGDGVRRKDQAPATPNHSGPFFR